MAKRWTADELQFVKDNYGKIDAREIAAKLNKTYPSIRGKANKLGLIVRKQVPLKPHFKHQRRRCEECHKLYSGSYCPRCQRKEG